MRLPIKISGGFNNINNTTLKHTNESNTLSPSLENKAKEFYFDLKI